MANFKNSFKYFGVVAISYFVGMITAFIVYGTTGYVDTEKPYHYLYQITKTSSTYESVDADANGIIDHTDADLTEILNNGHITDHVMTINALLTADNLNVNTQAHINQLNAGNAVVSGDLTVSRSTTTDTLKVVSNADILNIQGYSLSYQLGDFSTSLSSKNLVVSKTLTTSTANIDELCLKDATGSYVCIDEWDDLLDILFAST